MSWVNNRNTEVFILHMKRETKRLTPSPNPALKTRRSPLVLFLVQHHIVETQAGISKDHRQQVGLQM